MPARYLTIADMARERKWTEGAELGVFDGATHFHLVENVPGLTLYGVDVWDAPGFREGPTKSGERCFCPHCEATRAARKKAPVAKLREEVLARSAVEPRSVILEMTTAAAASLIGAGSLDFVFVDADHSREGVSADIKLWRPKIRPGGMLIGHDWNMASVRAGVLEHFPPGGVKTGWDDHLWMVPC